MLRPSPNNETIWLPDHDNDDLTAPIIQSGNRDILMAESESMHMKHIVQFLLCSLNIFTPPSNIERRYFRKFTLSSPISGHGILQ